MKYIFNMIKRNIFAFLLTISLFNSLNCLKEESIEYDVLEYLKEKKYILNATEKNEITFYLQMEADKILTSDCLLNIYQTDPQSVSLEYKFEKDEEKSDFKYLKQWIVTNNKDKHVYYYDIEKPEEKGKILYLKILVKNYKDKQEFSVESTDYQFNYYLLIILILIGSFVFVFALIFFIYYCQFKAKTNFDDLNNVDIIFAKVGPEDF